jgi:hypothetical protein
VTQREPTLTICKYTVRETNYGVNPASCPVNIIIMPFTETSDCPIDSISNGHIQEQRVSVLLNRQYDHDASNTHYNFLHRRSILHL